MDWDEWCKQYPAEPLLHKPTDAELPIETNGYECQVEAEHIKEGLERDYNIGGMIVGEWSGRFYVVWRDIVLR